MPGAANSGVKFIEKIMRTEYRFTEQSKALLAHIDELRAMALEPIKKESGESRRRVRAVILPRQTPQAAVCGTNLILAAKVHPDHTAVYTVDLRHLRRHAMYDHFRAWRVVGLLRKEPVNGQTELERL